jgi:primosomal protein N' (replication factor Y)
VYAQVVVNIPDIRHSGFDYLVPDNLADIIDVGSRVIVPLANREVMGYVIALKTESDISRIKPISRCLDDEPTINQELIKLAVFMQNYYSSHLYNVLQLLTPTTLKTKDSGSVQQVRYLRLLVDRNELLIARDKLSAGAKRQRDIIDYFLSSSLQEVPIADWLREMKISSSSVQALVDQGLFEIIERDKEYDLLGEKPDKQVELTVEQNAVLERLEDSLNENETKTTLLYGITGSGKTELYLELIEKVLSANKSAIVLVPEIALTTQMIARFSGRFGNLVALLHSRLSSSERLAEWKRIKSGAARIVVGARSAVFAPVVDLGLIVIDEEHETSYKQEEHPRYHTREIAQWRANENGALLILGSATPSLESYYKAVNKRYNLLELKERYNGGQLPAVEVVDLRAELTAGNRSMFSRSLQIELTECLARGEQAILFLNRRGYSTFVSCRSCGYVVRCPHCDITLTYHRTNDVLRCHYCGYAQKNLTSCPECTGRYIRFFGTGTQKVEEELRNLLPSARIERLDYDSTTKKGSHEQILDRFREHQADILLGTQMVAKGLDFEKVSLVGVIAADTILGLPDFRAAERTFQLLTQVSGRAGRHQIPGKVIVQTYTPEHYSIRYAQEHDYIGFYREELIHRKQLNYPPYSKLALIGFSHLDLRQAVRVSNHFVSELRAMVPVETVVHDPVSSPIARIKDRNRLQTMIKYQDRDETVAMINQVLVELLEIYKDRNLQITVDINPYVLM